MALQCRVVLNENNEIDYVKTEDGQRSQLFDGLAETLGGDKNSALGFYALTESEDFKTAQKAKKTESPVYSVAKIYKDRLTKEKQNNPSQYWSVDIPSDEVIEDAARNGRIVDVNGGMGIVTEDGNMIGMFKYDKNAKNTAQAVQEARIQKGGVKLDNYDGYLTKLYQKNGFRVAARLPFNKEFAPEDWSEEVSGTPDVVFMVYDPQNKLKIEEKIFEDYDEASNYRDSFVEEAKALKSGKQNTEFFEGKAKEASSKIPYTPVLKVDQTTPVAKAYSLYTAGGNFTGHISKMIAGFQEKQKQVAEAIVKGGFKNFLDLGTSEGGMIKTVASQDRGIKAVGIDPNREMQKNFNFTPRVENAEFRLEAFQGSWTEDDGTKIKEFKTNQKFDVVNEDFMFQFVNNNREKQVKGVKELMTPNGIFVTSEKFHTANEAANELKKYDHQRKYFSPDQLTEDKQTIVSGMADDMVNDVEYFNILKKNFKFVEEFWNAGNFKGYLASDNLEILKEFKNNVGDLTSEFTDETSLTKPRPLVEPSVEDVIQYANSTEEELSPEQIIDLQDVIMSLGVDNSKEAEKKLKEALETKGFIRFNKRQMLNSGAFNKYEVKQILNLKEKQDQVEQSYRALKNSPTIEVEYPKDSVNRESKINSFGKQSVINPLLPIENEGVEVKTVTKEGALENKTTGTDTEVILNNTYIGEENIKLSENLFFITKTFSPAVWENKKDSIFKVVKQIKEYAKDSGIDLKNIEEKVYTKSREEIINFFESLEDFLQKGDATEFASLYNEMFELNKPVKESIRTENKFDVYMDEDVSEYEAFTKHNLVKKSPTVYRKIKGDLSLDEAYSIIAQNESISEEQLRKEVRENPLEVSDYEVDVEELEKMQLYKRYFNFPKNVPIIKTTNQKKSFIRKANKWLLKSGNPYYKITKNGLELVSQDEITRSRAELTLPEYLKQEEKEEVIVEDLNKERRLEALANPSSVQKVKGEFLYLEPEVVAIKNEVESMVRTPRGVFEYMYGQGNVGFYGKVTSEERPLSDMNYKQYTYLENSPELFQKAKNYYSKAELDEINRDNFECS